VPGGGASFYLTGRLRIDPLLTETRRGFPPEQGSEAGRAINSATPERAFDILVCDLAERNKLLSTVKLWNGNVQPAACSAEWRCPPSETRGTPSIVPQIAVLVTLGGTDMNAFVRCSPHDYASTKDSAGGSKRQEFGPH